LKLFKSFFPDFRRILNSLYGVTRNKELGYEITVEDFENLSIGKDSKLFDFIVTEFDPHKIFKFVKVNYNGKEIQALQSLSEGFLEYLATKGKYSKIGGSSIIIQKYGYEPRTGSLNMMITLLACCSALSNLFKS